VVVVVLENHTADEILGHPDAPFLDGLASSGAVLTDARAVTHPSEPNYLALFSGSTHGLTDDSCPHVFSGGNLGTALIAAGRTFIGYSEGLPQPGYTGCSAGRYARKHAPWVDFSDLPPATDQPMTAFAADPARLPSVGFVIPDLDHDMHDGSRAAADAWLRVHLSAYAGWAPEHDSLLVLTTDEDDYSAGNRIATVLAGAHVRPGRYATRVDHYGLLRTIETMFGLPLLGRSSGATPVPAAVWS
jgi:acid phosphatase